MPANSRWDLIRRLRVKLHLFPSAALTSYSRQHLYPFVTLTSHIKLQLFPSAALTSYNKQQLFPYLTLTSHIKLQIFPLLP